LNSLKLEYASNRLIGKLFHLGYLERDPENPDKRSRLTQSACLLINGPAVQPVVSSGIVVKEEDVKILTILDSLKQAAGAYSALSEEHTKAVNDLEKMNLRSIQLQKRFEKYTELITKKIENSEKEVSEKTSEIEVIAAKITPRMIEANRRLELMFSDLPNE
jgi:CRISPR/Cas system CSM-associated protein Csm2 small subunit